VATGNLENRSTNKGIGGLLGTVGLFVGIPLICALGVSYTGTGRYPAVSQAEIRKQLKVDELLNDLGSYEEKLVDVQGGELFVADYDDNTKKIDLFSRVVLNDRERRANNELSVTVRCKDGRLIHCTYKSDGYKDEYEKASEILDGGKYKGDFIMGGKIVNSESGHAYLEGDRIFLDVGDKSLKEFTLSRN
jgi:hypothetical protein